MLFLFSWIEHDPYDLLDSAIRCADEAVRKFGMMGHDIKDLKGKEEKKTMQKSGTLILI